EQRRDTGSEKLRADHENRENQRDQHEEHDEDAPQHADGDDDGVLAHASHIRSGRAFKHKSKGLVVLGDPDYTGGTSTTVGGDVAGVHATRTAAAVETARGAVSPESGCVHREVSAATAERAVAALARGRDRGREADRVAAGTSRGLDVADAQGRRTARATLHVLVRGSGRHALAAGAL